MVGGQMHDLEIEGRYGKRKSSLKQIRSMQQLKTAALFAFACKAGAILGNASKKHRQSLEEFGRSFGEAFQIADDLSDAKADKASGKVTLVTIVGEQKARIELARLVRHAGETIQPFGERANHLREYLKFVG